MNNTNSVDDQSVNSHESTLSVKESEASPAVASEPRSIVANNTQESADTVTMTKECDKKSEGSVQTSGHLAPDTDKNLDNNSELGLAKNEPEGIAVSCNQNDVAKAPSPSVEVSPTKDDDYEPSADQINFSIISSLTDSKSMSDNLKNATEPLSAVNEKSTDVLKKEAENKGTEATDEAIIKPITANNKVSLGTEPACEPIMETITKEAVVSISEAASNDTSTFVEKAISDSEEGLKDPKETIPEEKIMDDIDRALNNEDVEYSSDEEGGKILPEATSVGEPGAKATKNDNENESSSDSSSDSSDSSSSDSDSDESDAESEVESNEGDATTENGLRNGGSKKNKGKNRAGSSAGVDFDDDEDDYDSNEPVKTINEIVDEPAPKLPDNLVLNENTQIEYAGTVFTVSEKSLVISAGVSGEFRILNENSVFCFEDKTPIGVLYETFGRIQSPMHMVKFDSPEQAVPFKSRIGEKVYYVVSNSSFILTDAIKKIKGCDASNIHDEEIPEEEQEFSDDEKERERKQKQNKKKRKRNKKGNSNRDGMQSEGVEDDGVASGRNASKSNQKRPNELQDTQEPSGRKQRRSNNNRPPQGMPGFSQASSSGPFQQQYDGRLVGYGSQPTSNGYWGQARDANSTVATNQIPPEQLQLLQQLASLQNQQNGYSYGAGGLSYTGSNMGYQMPSMNVPNAASLIMNAMGPNNILASFGFQNPAPYYVQQQPQYNNASGSYGIDNNDSNNEPDEK